MSTSRHVATLREALRVDGWMLVGDEPLKITLCPKPRGCTGVEIAQQLERQSIYCEFADPDYIVFMLTYQLPVDAYAALLAALRGIPPRAPITEQPPALGQPERVLTPREAMLAPSETLLIEQALGRVLASPGVSCPPAVPILVCGERIDEAAIRAFRYYGIEQVEVVK